MKNEATGEVFESNWTDSETFEYRHHLPEDSCGLMQFTVIAKNPAGLSDASQPLIKNMPTGKENNGNREKEPKQRNKCRERGRGASAANYSCSAHTVNA